MLLNLIKPIAIFDLETTGLNITKDRIVEIAIIKLIQMEMKKHFIRMLILK